MGGVAATAQELEGAGPGGLERRRNSAAPLESGQGPRQLGLVGIELRLVAGAVAEAVARLAVSPLSGAAARRDARAATAARGGGAFGRRRREGRPDVLVGDPRLGQGARDALAAPARQAAFVGGERPPEGGVVEQPLGAQAVEHRCDLVGGVALVEQAAAQLGPGARAMSKQTVSVGQHPCRRGLGAQRLDLGGVELLAGEEVVARDQRLGDDAHELAVDVQGDAPPLRRSQRADRRHWDLLPPRHAGRCRCVVRVAPAPLALAGARVADRASGDARVAGRSSGDARHAAGLGRGRRRFAARRGGPVGDRRQPGLLADAGLDGVGDVAVLFEEPAGVVAPLPEALVVDS